MRRFQKSCRRKHFCLEKLKKRNKKETTSSRAHVSDMHVEQACRRYVMFLGHSSRVKWYHNNPRDSINSVCVITYVSYSRIRRATTNVNVVAYFRVKACRPRWLTNNSFVYMCRHTIVPRARHGTTNVKVLTYFYPPGVCSRDHSAAAV